MFFFHIARQKAKHLTADTYVGQIQEDGRHNCPQRKLPVPAAVKGGGEHRREIFDECCAGEQRASNRRVAPVGDQAGEQHEANRRRIDVAAAGELNSGKGCQA